jgi:hypothetical protein
MGGRRAVFSLNSSLSKIISSILAPEKFVLLSSDAASLRSAECFFLAEVGFNAIYDFDLQNQPWLGSPSRSVYCLVPEFSTDKYQNLLLSGFDDCILLDKRYLQKAIISALTTARGDQAGAVREIRFAESPLLISLGLSDEQILFLQQYFDLGLPEDKRFCADTGMTEASLWKRFSRIKSKTGSGNRAGLVRLLTLVSMALPAGRRRDSDAPAPSARALAATYVAAGNLDFRGEGRLLATVARQIRSPLPTGRS